MSRPAEAAPPELRSAVDFLTAAAQPRLSSFWRLRERWPRSTARNLFIGDAIEQVGRVEFGAEWDGSEFHAYAHIPSRLELFPPGRQSPTPRSIASDYLDHTWPEPVAGRPSDSAIDKAHVYLCAVNEPRLRRLQAAVERLWAELRDGETRTLVRWVRSDLHGELSVVDAAFWNVDDIFATRLRNGVLPADCGVSPAETYLFVDRASFNEFMEVQRAWFAPPVAPSEPSNKHRGQSVQPTPSSIADPPTPQRGRGYGHLDAPLVHQMRDIIVDEAISDWQAAARVAGLAAGGGGFEAKQKRLVSLYKKNYPEEF